MKRFIFRLSLLFYFYTLAFSSFMLIKSINNPIFQIIICILTFGVAIVSYFLSESHKKWQSIFSITFSATSLGTIFSLLESCCVDKLNSEGLLMWETLALYITSLAISFVILLICNTGAKSPDYKKGMLLKRILIPIVLVLLTTASILLIVLDDNKYISAGLILTVITFTLLFFSIGLFHTSFTDKESAQIVAKAGFLIELYCSVIGTVAAVICLIVVVVYILTFKCGVDDAIDFHYRTRRRYDRSPKRRVKAARQPDSINTFQKIFFFEICNFSYCNKYGYDLVKKNNQNTNDTSNVLDYTAYSLLTCAVIKKLKTYYDQNFTIYEMYQRTLITFPLLDFMNESFSLNAYGEFPIDYTYSLLINKNVIENYDTCIQFVKINKYHFIALLDDSVCCADNINESLIQVYNDKMKFINSKTKR